MTISRVDSVWAGTYVRGGGLTQHYFGESTTDAQACVDAIEAFWTAVLGNVSSAVTVTIRPEVTLLDEVTGNLEGLAVTTGAGPLTGGSGGNALPPATQILIRWFTPQVANNRLIRGKTFLPAITELASTAAGVPEAASIAACDTAGQALIDDADTDFGIWHRPRGVAPGSFGIATSVSTWNEFAVLRSRRD